MIIFASVSSFLTYLHIVSCVVTSLGMAGTASRLYKDTVLVKVISLAINTPGRHEPSFVYSHLDLAHVSDGEERVRVREYCRSLGDDTHRTAGLEERAPAEPTP